MREGQIDSFTRPPRFRATPPAFPPPTLDPGSPVLLPPAGARPDGGSHSPRSTDHRFSHTTRLRGGDHQPTDESRNSPGLPARRFLSVSSLRSVDQTKESEKRPTTSEFQEPLALSPMLLLFLSPTAWSICPLRFPFRLKSSPILYL